MQDFHKGLYLFRQCATYAQDLHKTVLLSPMPNICARFAQDSTSFSNAQYMCKICEDCTSFFNAQYMHNIFARLYFLPQCAIYAQDLRKVVLLSTMQNICTRFAQDCSYSSNAQYMARFAQDRTSLINEQYMHTICPRFVLLSSMSNICTRLYIFLHCEIYEQDLHKIAVIPPMCNRCTKFAKIVVISPMRNICTRFGQDCSHFSNAQYMRKSCTRLYLFRQCAIYAQDLCKILLLSPMHNICARFAQDCTYFSNVRYMHKICARL